MPEPERPGQVIVAILTDGYENSSEKFTWKDISRKILEQTNAYNQHPEIVAQLTKLLEKYVADGRSTPGPKQQNDVPIKLWKIQPSKASANLND